MTTAQVKAAIRHDPRLSDPVRRQALKLAGSYAQRLVRHAAERVVRALYDGAMFQAEVLESLRTDPSLSEPVRKEAIALAESMAEDPFRLNAASWGVVRHRDGTPQAIGRAVRTAKAACRILTKSGSVWNTLGVAEYRAGSYEDAIATLTVSAQYNAEQVGYPDPADLAFLALSHHRLGHTRQALEFLGRLRETMRNAGTCPKRGSSRISSRGRVIGAGPRLPRPIRSRGELGHLPIDKPARADRCSGCRSPLSK